MNSFLKKKKMMQVNSRPQKLEKKRDFINNLQDLFFIVNQKKTAEKCLLLYNMINNNDICYFEFYFSFIQFYQFLNYFLFKFTDT